MISISKRLAGILFFLILSLPPSSVAADDFVYPDPPDIGEANFFSVAENGEAKCVIVIPRGRISPELKQAAETLKIYLNLVTGAAFEVATAPPTDDRGAIHLGATKAGESLDLKLPSYGDPAAPLPNIHGFLIQTIDEKNLVIRGATDHGTLFGVVALLKRAIGVHRGWVGDPGGLGDAIPHKPTLGLPEIEWRDWPRFLSRHLSNLYSSGPPRDPSVSAARLDDWLMLDYSIPSNESYNHLLPVEKYGATHPEYYPLHGDARFVPAPEVVKSWQPCVSNPGVAQAMAEALNIHFDTNPEAIAVNFAVNDGTGDCECAACRALDLPGADYGRRIGLSDRYIEFSNRVAILVAAKHPGKKLAFLSYGSVVLPPQREKLHPNLIPVVTMSAMANAFQRWDDWQATGAQLMGFYCYHNDQHHFVLPKIDIHQTARRIRYIADTGHAIAYYKEATPMWPLVAPLLQVESALLWDPRRDVNAILREHYAAFFGPAAEPMGEFYATLEAGYERWLGEEGLPHPAGKDIGALRYTRSIEQFKVLNLSEIAKADVALESAIVAAQNDEEVGRRIHIVKAAYDFAALGARQYWLLEQIQSSRPQSEADALLSLDTARKIVDAARQQADLKERIISQPPVSYYANYTKTFGKPGNNSLFIAVEKDAILPDISIGIARAFEGIGESLSSRVGADRATAWWKEQERLNSEPLLAPAFRLASLRASGGVFQPLVKDPGFETRPTEKLNITLRSAANAKVELTDTEAHGGRRSLVFESCGRAGVSESVAAKPGQQLRISVWVKQVEEGGDCQVEIEPRAGAKRLRPAIVTASGAPDEWKEVTADFTAPPGTTSVMVMVRVLAQPSGARTWVDDLNILSYPEP